MVLILDSLILLALGLTQYCLPDIVYHLFPHLGYYGYYIPAVVPQIFNIAYIIASLIFFLYWVDIWRFHPIRSRFDNSRFIFEDLFLPSIILIWFTTVLTFILKSTWSTQLRLVAQASSFWELVNIPVRYFNNFINPPMPGLCSFLNQYAEYGDLVWVVSNISVNHFVNFNFFSDFLFSIFFVDWISFWLIMLVILTVSICILTLSEIGHKLHLYTISLCWISFFMILAFTTANVLVFYCSFEAVLIPTFFLIGIFGSSPTRVPAAYRLFLFTTVGSVLILLAMVLMYCSVGSLNFWELRVFLSANAQLQFFILPLLFFGFSFKIPFFPVYLWLTSAHVEAPTAGSMILASLMLKLGVYGLLRFCFQLCPEALFYWSSLFFIFPLIGFTYVSYLTYAINDFKRLIAYTSVSHMNFLILAMNSTSSLGFSSAVYTTVSHAIISSALFFLIGCLYRRNGNRSLALLSGLADTTPRLFFFLSLFLFANAGLPLFAGFPGELFALISLWQCDPYLFIVVLPGFYFLVFGMVRALSGGCGTALTTAYSPLHKSLSLDLTSVEFAGVFVLFLWQFVMALAPYIFLNSVFY